MPETNRNARTRDDLALLSVVGELVIDLSIAERTQQIYGREHPMSRNTLQKARAKLHRALEHTDPVVIQFSPEAVFCGTHSLEHGNPVYRRFAEKMWELGIAGLSFGSGIEEDELGELMGRLNRARIERVRQEDVEEMLAAAELGHVRVEMLRSLLSYTRTETTETLDEEEQRELWEELVHRLAAIRRGHVAEEEDDQAEEPPELAEDYAEAVIDYMKNLERSRQRNLLLRETELGRKIGAFLDEANPELRRQIMSTAITSPEVSPELLERLVHLVGQEEMVDALRRVSAAGADLPPSAYRTLALMARLEPDPLGRSGSDADGDRPSGEELRRLMDNLLSDDQGRSYMSAGYEKAIQKIQAQAERLGHNRGDFPVDTGFRSRDAEKHFLRVGAELLQRFPEDRQLAEAVGREAQESFRSFLEHGLVPQCRSAMNLARGARAAAGHGAEEELLAWEQDRELSRLTEILVTGDHWESEEAADLLASIGPAAVPELLGVLAGSERIRDRKRALAALEAMPESPAPALVPLLDRSRPWYLQRNAVFVLRRRGESKGLAAAKSAWKGAPQPLRLEILDYLLQMEDPERFEYLRRALEAETEAALSSARHALREADAETVRAVIGHIGTLGLSRLGSELHLGLLRLLAHSGHPEARRYLEEEAGRRAPLVPWRRLRFREELRALVEEASP